MDHPCIMLRSQYLGNLTKHLRMQSLTSWLFGRLLSAKVLKHARPAAVLLTGDLTDGKSSHGSGRQSQSEWQVLISL